MSSNSNSTTHNDNLIRIDEGADINGWEVIKQLGEGGFATVFLVRHRQNGQYGALKMEKLVPRIRPSVEVEIEILRKMANCEGFCEIIEEARNNDFTYVVMTHLGECLQDLRRKAIGRVLPAYAVTRWAMQAAKSLGHLHSNGFIHRDVKPANLCIDKDNSQKLYLIDFGISCRDGANVRGFSGTHRYCSLQQDICEKPKPKDDLWALLHTMIELCNGRLPWTQLNEQQSLERKDGISDEELCFNTPFIKCLYLLKSRDNVDAREFYRCLEQRILPELSEERINWNPMKVEPADLTQSTLAESRIVIPSEQIRAIRQKEKEKAKMFSMLDKTRLELSDILPMIAAKFGVDPHRLMQSFGGQPVPAARWARPEVEQNQVAELQAQIDSLKGQIEDLTAEAQAEIDQRDEQIARMQEALQGFDYGQNMEQLRHQFQHMPLPGLVVQFDQQEHDDEEEQQIGQGMQRGGAGDYHIGPQDWNTPGHDQPGTSRGGHGRPRLGGRQARMPDTGGSGSSARDERSASRERRRQQGTPDSAGRANINWDLFGGPVMKRYRELRSMLPRSTSNAEIYRRISGEYLTLADGSHQMIGVCRWPAVQAFVGRNK